MTTGDDRILVVDDDDAGRHIKTHILKRAGYKVTETALGREAVSLTRNDRPHLVLLDVKLPDINGIEVCRLIKETQPEVMVLQTSAAFIKSADRAIGLSGGADAYLIAPIEPAELIASVGALLRLSGAERELREFNETLEQQVRARTQELAEANEQLRDEMEQRRKAEETLLHAQKLDAIGQLTGGIAHDFNNLLTVVLGNLELLKNRLNKPELPAKEALLRFADAGEHAARQCAYLTRQLLSFARRDALRLETVDVNAAIGRYSTLLGRALGDQVKLDLAVDLAVWPSRIDLPQLEAALLNLTVNARDAMPNGGTLRVATHNIAIPAASLPVGVPLPREISPGDYVVVSFSDTGTGMTDDVLAHAFEPFFTTKDIGKGSGLGLSQVYGFIKQAGGAVGVASALGRGTRIALYLPRSKDAVGTGGTSPKAAAAAPPQGSETILVVEDHELVLSYVMEMLTDLGYTAVSASDGPGAMKIIRSDRNIDLLFTDVVMPHQMSGIELARQARQIRPKLKVLVTSGYSASVVEDSSDEFRYIGKPYDITKLAKSLREILGP